VVRALGGRTYEREVGPNDLLDIHEAAAALGNLHVYSVYRLIWERRLPVVRQGRNVLIRLRDITRYRKTTRRSPAVKGRSIWFAG
jgi:excisionase family DNA binding protein